MTICLPQPIRNIFIFWNNIEPYINSSFILQQYSGPLWWSDDYRIVLLCGGDIINKDSSGSNGNSATSCYVIATSPSFQDIISNWQIINTVYQEKVEKTGLTQFSDTFLLHIYKKLAKKLAKINSPIYLDSNPTTSTTSTTSTISLATSPSSIPSSQSNENSNISSPSSSYSPPSSSSLPSSSSTTPFLISQPTALQNNNNNSNSVGGFSTTPSQLTLYQQHQLQQQQLSNSPTNLSPIIQIEQVELGKQRKVLMLFKTLYHEDRLSLIEKNYVKHYPNNEWIEWVDESTGMRPIHVATEKRDIQLVKFLIERKVDVNLKDLQGWAPLHFASFSGNLEICQILIEQGNASVLSISKDGTLPLHYLARHSTSEQSQINKLNEVLNLLLDKGTPINAKTIRGESALHRACYNGSISVVQFLIEKGADLNIQNNRGETPLFFAVASHQKKIVKLLMENGADCNLGGSTGSAFSIASKTNQNEIMCFLIGFSNDDRSIQDRLQEEEKRLKQQEEEELKRQQEEKEQINNQKSQNYSKSYHLNNNNCNSNNQFFPHVFVYVDFNAQTHCSLCNYLLWGIRKQGFSCEICGYVVHPKCKKKATLTENCEVAQQISNMVRNTSNDIGSSQDSNDLRSSISSVVDDYLSSSRDLSVAPISLHTQNINRKRLESLYNHFSTLDKEKKGIIQKKDFSDCLGTILSGSNSLSSALFSAFDSNKDDKLNLNDFLNGISILQNSTFNRQIKFAFKMLDKDQKGYITVEEFLSILESMCSSLSNLKIITTSPCAFLKQLLPQFYLGDQIKDQINYNINVNNSNNNSNNNSSSNNYCNNSQNNNNSHSIISESPSFTSTSFSSISPTTTPSTSPTNNLIIGTKNSSINKELLLPTSLSPSTASSQSSNSSISDNISFNSPIKNNSNYCNVNKKNFRSSIYFNKVDSPEKSSNSIGNHRTLKNYSNEVINSNNIQDDSSSSQSNESNSQNNNNHDNNNNNNNNNNIDNSILSKSSNKSMTDISKFEQGFINDTYKSQSLPELPSHKQIADNQKPLEEQQPIDSNHLNNFQQYQSYQKQKQNHNSSSHSSISASTSSLSLNNHSLTSFSPLLEMSNDKRLFKLDGKIFFKDYKKVLENNLYFVKSLGLVNHFESNGVENRSSNWIASQGKDITIGHENWELIQYIMIGIRRAVGEAIALPNRTLKPKDFELIVEFKYNGWMFKDHFPMAFKKIRERLEIDTKMYMYSLGPERVFGNLLLGNLSVLSEMNSSGRSGSIFFRSSEGDYLIKTIPSNEEAVLKNILPHYLQHLQKYPNSLLIKLLGCYSIQTKSKPEMKFLVMNNLFFTPLPIAEKYDLKGSTIGRHVEINELNDNDSDDSNDCGDDTEQQDKVLTIEDRMAQIALKDLDFKRILDIGPEFKAPLLEQIENDTKFLESHNICDYSLLVGVHIIDENSPLALTSDEKDQWKVLEEEFFKKTSGKTSLFQKDIGGILSRNKKEVYFIAIIDTLTPWNFSKQYENFFKSIIHDASKISAISPSAYRKRFQTLVSNIVQ